MINKQGTRILLATHMDHMHIWGTLVYDAQSNKLGDHSQGWNREYFEPLDKNRVVTLGNT